MRIRMTILAGMLVTGATIYPAQADITLADQGKSTYQIVVADDASPSTRHGAAELQTFLKEITGARLPIVSDKTPLAENEIVLGDNAHLRALGVTIDLDRMGDEGYLIRTAGTRVIIAGGSQRGNLYGVYGLLEDHLGCRWFTPDVSRIPQATTLTIGSINDVQVPALEYREPFTKDCFDGDWCARNRVNSSSGQLEERHGGKIQFGAGFFVHTFDRLVPPDQYFDEHPEYFALVKGKRLKERTQLCCTNEDVIRICTEGILTAMRAQPNAFVFSVSQNDWHNYCTCDKCKALAEKEGAQIAPVLQLVNRVAKSIEQEFPNKAIETLAYQWTRKPPKQLRPRPNVIIRLCSIECCFAHPLSSCDGDENRKFREDTQAWAKVSKRLWVWDYVTDFRHYLLPFPNQRVRNDNIQFFIKNNVTGIFEQDTYNTPQSELAELGGYMTAKFLWNPAYDENKAMDEFLAAYYGKAAGSVRAYIDMLHDRVEKENIHVNIWAPPTSAHVTEAVLVQANQLWEQAEWKAEMEIGILGLIRMHKDARQKRVEAKQKILRRVRLSRMSVDYAILERARAQKLDKIPLDAAFQQLAAERLEPFMNTLRDSNVTRLNEWKSLDAKTYRNELGKTLYLE